MKSAAERAAEEIGYVPSLSMADIAAIISREYQDAVSALEDAERALFESGPSGRNSALFAKISSALSKVRGQE